MNKLYNIKEIKLKHGIIKPIQNFEDFSSIIDVFKEPPYGEPLTLEDKLEEFSGYLEKGLALGYYSFDGKIMGYAGLMAEVEEEHTPYFSDLIDNLNPLYIYGLATKKQYRNKGICSTLVRVVNDLAEYLGIDFVYLRINDEGSMSENLSRHLGYVDLYKDGVVAVQDVSQHKSKISENTCASANIRRFLIKPTSFSGELFLRDSGSILESEESLVLSKK